MPALNRIPFSLRKDVFAPPTATVVKPVQPSKALSPILFTASGIERSVRLAQFEKACLPMEIKEAGSDSEAKLEQPPNANLPMLSSPSGKLIAVRCVHSKKA